MQDTSEMLNKANVSYGVAYDCALNNGVFVSFIRNKLITASRIDETNLVYCLYLNLAGSSVTYLDTKYFNNL